MAAPTDSQTAACRPFLSRLRPEKGSWPGGEAMGWGVALTRAKRPIPPANSGSAGGAKTS